MYPLRAANVAFDHSMNLSTQPRSRDDLLGLITKLKLAGLFRKEICQVPWQTMSCESKKKILLWTPQEAYPQVQEKIKDLHRWNVQKN